MQNNFRQSINVNRLIQNKKAKKILSFIRDCYFKINLIITNPAIKRIVNNIANKLKYFSIKKRIFSPKTYINVPNKKNLALRLSVEATINIKKLILKVPEDIVMSLKGIGVKPAVKTIQKFHSSYKFFILLKLSIVNPGTYSKKILASAEYSISGTLHQSVFPIKYPNTPPTMDETLHKKAK